MREAKFLTRTTDMLGELAQFSQFVLDIVSHIRN